MALPRRPDVPPPYLRRGPGGGRTRPVVNVLDDIRARAAEDPRHPAIASARGAAAEIDSTTYAELVASVDAQAAILRLQLRQPALRVGLIAPQGRGFIESALAIMAADACMVPIAADQSESALRAFFERAGLNAVVRLTGDELQVETLAPPGERYDDFAAIDPAYVRFTSGTTSERKGVVISHARIVERLDAANRGMQISAADRVMWLLPMAHHFVVSILLYLRNGATILLPGGSLARSVLDLAARTRPTVFYASPYYYRLLGKDASATPLDSLRLAVSTAEGLPAATAQRFAERFGHPLVQALGIIEVGLPVMNRNPDKAAALGKPLPDYEVWLRGEDGEAVAASTSPERTGEVCIRGPGMFDAYIHPWTPSAAILEPDGFRTGDQGWFDEDGDLHLAGRRANRINMAGMKFFAEEVEAVLERHPAVEHSRVYAREHAHLGQIPVAEIVVTTGCEPPSPRELTAACRELLPSYKVPRRFDVVDALEMTPTGKVRRYT